MINGKKNRAALALSLAAFVLLAASGPEREKKDPAALDREEAKKAIASFDAQKAHFAARNIRIWDASRVASLVGGGGGLGFPRLEGSSRALMWQFSSRLLLPHDDGPVEELFRAIRLVRRALKKNNKDHESHFLLGEAYYRLSKHTSERVWARYFEWPVRLRSVQIVSACTSALRLNPDLPEAHARLLTVYQALGCKDLQFKHLQAYLKSIRKRGPQAECKDQFADRVAAVERIVRTFEKELQQLQDRYAVNSADLKIVERANLALRLGLHGEALEVLLKSDIAVFGVAGMDLELQLLLISGAADKVQAWTEPGHEELLGSAKYHWYKAQAGLALGDYEAADVALQEPLKIPGFAAKIPLRTAMARVFGAALLADTDLLPLRKVGAPSNHMKRMWDIARLLDQEAGIKVWRGLLALESGRTKKAAELFDEALHFWNSPTGVALRDMNPDPGRGIAEHYRYLINHRKVGNK